MTVYETYEKLYKQSKHDEHTASDFIKPIIQESTASLRKSMDTISIEMGSMEVEDDL
jgi:hypothetical protein